MKLLLILFPIVAALMLPSCIETLDTGYGGGGYGGGGYGGGGYGGGYSSGYSRPYQPSGYYNNGYYPNRYPDRRYYDNDHDHDHSSHSGGDGKVDSDKIKLIGGHDPRKPNRPDGYHSADWYRKNGYDLRKYTIKDDEGDVRKAHSSSSHHDDDKKKKHR